VVDVGLDGGRLLHHALAEGADPRHVRAHDPVALLRHPLDLLEAADRLHAEAQEGEPELVADAEDLADVGLELLVGAVDGRALRAGELELRAGLERDRRPCARERHDPAILFLGLPAEALREPAQDGLDAARAGERRRPAGRPLDGDLLVLGSDHPSLARLSGAMELLDQLLDALDRDRVRALVEVRHPRPAYVSQAHCLSQGGAADSAADAPSVRSFDSRPPGGHMDDLEQQATSPGARWYMPCCSLP